MITPSAQVVLFSVSAGVLLGSVYSLLVILQRQKAGTLAQGKSKKAFFILTGALTFLRLSILGVSWYYLLRTEVIDSILLLISFLVSFWIVILGERVLLGGKR